MYYKVVERCGGTLHSLFPFQGWEVVYTPGVWVSPLVAGSKLFVFGSLDAATEFAKSRTYHDIEIWECEVKNPIKPPTLIPSITDNFWWKTYWTQLYLGYPSWSPLSGLRRVLCPANTVLCDEVLLTTRVKVLTHTGWI